MAHGRPARGGLMTRKPDLASILAPYEYREFSFQDSQNVRKAIQPYLDEAERSIAEAEHVRGLLDAEIKRSVGLEAELARERHRTALTGSEKAEIWDDGWHSHYIEHQRQREDPSHPITRLNPYDN